MKTNLTEMQRTNLDAACTKARNLKSAYDHDDIRGRYPIAVLIREGKDKAMFGDFAMERLREAAELSRAGAYRYVRVAETWSPMEFEALANKLDPNDHALSWSLVELIASAKDEATRQSLLQRWEQHGLTVKDAKALGGTSSRLRSIARAAESGTSGANSAPTRIAGVLDSIKEARRWVESLLDTSAGSAPTLTPPDRKRLRVVAERAKEARADLDALAARIESALSDHKSRAMPSSGPAGPSAAAAAP